MISFDLGFVPNSLCYKVYVREKILAHIKYIYLGNK